MRVKDRRQRIAHTRTKAALSRFCNGKFVKTVENFSRQLERAFFREQKWIDSRERRGRFSSPTRF
jgi:hypothetical protein